MKIYVVTLNAHKYKSMEHDRPRTAFMTRKEAEEFIATEYRLHTARRENRDLYISEIDLHLDTDF